MNNYRSSGRSVDIVAPFDVTSGTFLKIGSMCGFCGADASKGDKVALWVQGVFSVTKANSQQWTVGAAIYFDNDQKNFTTSNVSGGIKAGVAVEAVASTTGLTTGKIRLNGSF